jgi:hypothetical protein
MAGPIVGTTIGTRNAGTGEDGISIAMATIGVIGAVPIGATTIGVPIIATITTGAIMVTTMVTAIVVTTMVTAVVGITTTTITTIESAS